LIIRVGVQVDFLSRYGSCSLSTEGPFLGCLYAVGQGARGERSSISAVLTRGVRVSILNCWGRRCRVKVAILPGFRASVVESRSFWK
jgi:hypothetical protein